MQTSTIKSKAAARRARLHRALDAVMDGTFKCPICTEPSLGLGKVCRSCAKKYADPYYRINLYQEKLYARTKREAELAGATPQEADKRANQIVVQWVRAGKPLQ